MMEVNEQSRICFQQYIFRYVIFIISNYSRTILNSHGSILKHDEAVYVNGNFSFFIANERTCPSACKDQCLTRNGHFVSLMNRIAVSRKGNRCCAAQPIFCTIASQHLLTRIFTCIRSTLGAPVCTAKKYILLDN